MPGWYARRAAPWTALLAGLTILLVVLVAVHRWEGTAGLLLPLGVAVSAAACGFLFDEDALPVTTVTPRGTRWAWAVRLAGAALPLGAWAAAVSVLPSEVLVDTGGWVLVGTAAGMLAAGCASAASRLGARRPGGAVASGVALLVTLPLVIGGFLDWGQVFPFGPFPSWVVALWTAVGLVGLTLLIVSASPRTRSRPRPPAQRPPAVAAG